MIDNLSLNFEFKLQLYHVLNSKVSIPLLFEHESNGKLSNFLKGEVPEKQEGGEKMTQDKDAELEMMRKSKRQQREYFQMMEAGKLPEQDESPRRAPKLLVGKLVRNGLLFSILARNMQRKLFVKNNCSFKVV